MKAIKYFLLINFILGCYLAQAQVKTDFNNEALISNQGRFMKDYEIKIDFEIPPRDINALLDAEKREQLQSNETKPFKLAVPVTVDLDIARFANWTYDNKSAYGKFTISANGALSASINFNEFYLPKGTEMYVYNENGNMITGPVTENENNANKIWGSWVYKGSYIIIEIKTPISTKEQLLLHSNNIAYGYKQVYKTKVGGFGQSGSCNINVICPLGNGWEAERNSVSLILSDNGTRWCSGSMIMNTCNTNRPFFLTANHCFSGQNVAAWRFTFQYWSPTCPNPGVDVAGVTYNGSTLRANWGNSDFCLVELNNTPPANSGIHYAGWTRSTTPAQNATCMHHPSGDIMKISRANNPVTVASAFGTVNQHWQANWSPQNNGAGQIVTPITEGGSSGSPLFDQDHRIVGQLHGGPSACGASQLWDYYGRFDLSWIGGGTNATRLSNWLDPTNTGAVTTNTTNISAITPTITGPYAICPSGTYTISGLPTNATVTWTVSNPALASLSINGNTATVTSLVSGSSSFTLDATLTGACVTVPVISKFISIGAPIAYNVNYTNTFDNTVNPIGFLPGVTNAACIGYTILTSIDAPPGSTATWQKISSSNTVSWSQYQGALNFYLWGTNQNAIFQLDVSNSCGTDSRQAKWVSSNCGPCGGGFAFTVSPNPSKGKVKVVINNFPPPCFGRNSETAGLDFNALKMATLNVYNLAGTVIKTTKAGSVKQADIDFGYTTSGTYFVEIICTNGYKEKQMILINQ